MTRHSNATDRYMAEVINFGGLPARRFDALAAARDVLGYDAKRVDWFVLRRPAIDAEPMDDVDLRAVLAANA